MMRFLERRPAVFILLCCLALTVLWLPGLRYPVVSDTVHYAMLGQSLLHSGQYALSGVPYAAHLPLHAILSIPFTLGFGINLGMHLLSLAGGWATLIFTFLLFRRASSVAVAALATVFLVLHPAFILMSMLGSADLTFTSVLLAMLWMYLRAGNDRRWYVGSGLGLGLLCLTRYNGVPYFPLLFLWTAFARTKHLRSGWLWAGFGFGIGIASLWFLRNFVTFGDPFHTVYTAELAQESDGPLQQILNNIVYYGNPLRNVFLLLPFALLGLARHGRRQFFLVLAMLAAWPLTAIWWVQAIRFAFPGYPLLLGFAAMGSVDVWDRMNVRRKGFLRLGISTVVIVGALLVHAGFTCAYTYGQCNAFLDRHTNVLPKNMGLTPEGFEAWAQAKDWINDNAPLGAEIAIGGASVEPQLHEDIFRIDIRLVEPGVACPVYEITQRPEAGATILFTTKDAPETAVVLRACR